jgi:uncharacterized protein (TIGR02172 family)
MSLGRTAEIYAWDSDKVLKLFYDWFPAEDVEYEAAIAKAIYSSGFPVPEVGGIVEVNGRLGLEYERLNGKSMWLHMRAKPWMLKKYVSLWANLHAEIHACTNVKGIPTLRDKLEKRIRSTDELSSEVREESLSLLASLPMGTTLCHGDFHPGNIIMTREGPIVIDWIDAAIGNPLADVARTTILVMGEKETSSSTSILKKVMLDWAHRMYLTRYFKLRPAGEDEYRTWKPLVAAARISEGIEGLNSWLLAQSEMVTMIATD